MPIGLDVVTRTDEVVALRDDWQALADRVGDGPLLRGPTWLLAWWSAYRDALGADPLVLAARDGGRLVGVAPFYRRAATEGGIRVREVRMMGDAGPHPPYLSVVVEPGYEQACAVAMADALRSVDPPWDVVDLQPIPDVSRLRALFVQRMDPSGKRVRTSEGGTWLRVSLSLGGFDLDEVLPPDPRARAYVEDSAALRKGLAALRRLSRLEWADRDEPSPLADAEATRLLEDAVRQWGAAGHARFARLDDDAGEAMAGALVVDDGDRAVVLALAVDPERASGGAATRLLAAEARAAIERGLTAMDVVVGAAEYAPPPLPVQRRRALRLRIFNASASAALVRTYGALRRRVDAAREAPAAAAAGARAAWTRIRTAAASVAKYGRFHLYRGELWTRGIPEVPGLELSLLSQDAFDALSDADRDDLVSALELDEAYGRHKWGRGDLVVLARLDRRPAGIAWCARSAVEVPELERAVRPGPHECYIHDVFVAPAARGRNVAPAMLEFLAKQLRARDVYRSWALIEPNNVASVRAFEKAAYTAVADIVYARMAGVERVTVRPPDPQAKQLLGLA
ncbi:MAG: GNAT family N-acetyltransferase [Deltaproteobacteria bacterium]|nr:MAG: GNAT family N-acetyltransferase [Deltaproteobacteria bacterium]